MATSLSAQLQAIKNLVQAEPDPLRRPFTRPSILFDPKEAADIDLESLLSIALSGLEALVVADNRFGGYKNTLFSHKSLDVDRELMGLEENKSLNASISSYLRLLSGFLHMHSALKTLEYLIRRYKIHVYNVDELILCTLPYHDTTTFVRVVQLLQLSGKWAFLEGVKTSGAPLPRKVIVQQCIRDTGILEVLCYYALPLKKNQASTEVICFCTAVVVEALGAMPTLDNVVVKKILPFVYDGLDPAMKGGSEDHKAGAMMVVGILAMRAALAPKLINNLILFIARTAQQDAKNSIDLPWLRLSLMNVVNLVQSQNVRVLQKKALESLQEIRDFMGVLVELSKEFHIENFLCVYLSSLVDYSISDSSLLRSVIMMIETGLIREFVDNIVSKVLFSCLKLIDKSEDSDLQDPGYWAKQILVKINKFYPSELRGAVRKFFENPKMQSKQELIFEFLCKMFDGSFDMPLEISNSKLWFSLEHPKADVRRAAVSKLAASGMLKIESQNRANIQDAILRSLYDDDLSVVLETLSISGLFGLINPPRLFKIFCDIIIRCIEILNGNAETSSQAYVVAISCLDTAVLYVQQSDLNFSKEIASMMFPLLLIFPKTWRLNIKALELVKKIRWPFYDKLPDTHDAPLILPLKKFEPSIATSINAKTVTALAENLQFNVQECVPWMIDGCNTFKPSKIVFFLVIFQSFMMQKQVAGNFVTLFQAFFPVFKNEWSEMDSQGDVLGEELNRERLEEVCNGIMGKLLDWKSSALNKNVLVCTYWSLVKAAATMLVEDNSVDGKQKLQIFESLFVFSVSSGLKNVLLDELLRLVIKLCFSPVQYMSTFIVNEGFSTMVRVTSLQFFTSICTSLISSKKNGTCTDNQIQLLHEFPTLLVPLVSENRDIRTAALDCAESFYRLSNLIGNETMDHTLWTPALGELLGLIVQQRKLISSDANVLSSLLESLLGSSSHSLLVPQNIEKRFDEPTKKAILGFILSSGLNFSPNGKLKILSLFRRMGSTIVNIEEVRALLFELLDRWRKFYIQHEESSEQLSSDKIETLCILLEGCAVIPSSKELDTLVVGCLLKALNVNGVSSEDSGMVRPCVTVLTNFSSALYDSLGTKTQDEILQELVILIRNDNGYIHRAAREALLRINVSCATISRFLNAIMVEEQHRIGSSESKPKRKKSTKQNGQLHHGFVKGGGRTISFLTSLLDVLLLKKDITHRSCLIEPLFKLLHKTSERDWIVGLVGECEKACLESVNYVQQMILIILEDISASLSSDLLDKGDIAIKFNVDLLIDCARSANNPATRNHVFSLLSSIAKVFPEQVLDHILDIFTVIGESTIIQSDSHSQGVFEDLMSTVVPCWLSKTNRPDELFQIFINALPNVAEHRRLNLFVYLLRILGEKQSLGSLIVLLFHSLVRRMTISYPDGDMSALVSLSSAVHEEWEYMFALQVCEQYSCTIWLPSLVMVLQQSGTGNQDLDRSFELLIVLKFILHKLKATDLAFQLESGQDKDEVQRTLSVLMEPVVIRLQLVSARNKGVNLHTTLRRELKECIQNILKTITRSMHLSTFFETITRLLHHVDENVVKKALALLCAAVNDNDMARQKRRDKQNSKQSFGGPGSSMDETARKLFDDMCLAIVQLIDVSADDSDGGTKLAAISAVEILANKFPSNNSIFVKCLASITNYICSDSLVLSSSCLRSVGALINMLGPRALSEVPKIMECTLNKARDTLLYPSGKVKQISNKAVSVVSNSKDSLLMSILTMVEAVIDKLGGFLNPYLEDVVKLLVLHSEYTSAAHLKMEQKADSVRRLLTEKIPVRLILAPLLKIYPEAVHCGDWSVSELFKMLSNTIAKFDRSSVNLYHAKIFEHCLLALDIRHQNPSSVEDIDVIEEHVTHTIVVLTMKLTETMFRPLFIQSLEWAETGSEGDRINSGKNIDRSISLYKLINKLAEQHRSLFVPYFKYLRESCTQYLTDDGGSGLSQKRKKAKFQNSNKDGNGSGELSISQWHLRALILSSLHKCFLYDTGSLKFLDSTNFQNLLKPIVSQLVTEPPASLLQHPTIPSVEEVDDTLVLCLGQMAVTAGTDVLWQPLNHEVLMQTRSEKVRPRILGLRVLKCLVERLKEEFVAVFLPETVRFLGELLEDVELPVRSLAQQILKEMETISGENIKEYL